MDKPLVSIITPVYNSEKFLAETIASALEQTWPNKELILVDDGSTDSSLCLAQSYVSDNVKVFYQPNKGASAARNKGLQEARGEYIQFLDADDLLSPDKIANQVEALESQPGKVAACNTIHFKHGAPHQEGTPTRYEDSFLFDDDDPVHFLVNLLGGYRERGSMIAVHSWLTHRSLIDKAGWWNEDITTDDDGEFFCRVILNSQGIVKTNGYSYYRKYHDSGKSLSSQQSKKALESSFRSVLSKKIQLSVRSDLPPARLAIYKQLLNLAVSTYLQYPDLYRQIDKELKTYPELNVTPIMGGRSVNKIAQMFGWKTARFLQHYSKIFKKQ
ncbi:MAG TPA: glycosyltransferase family A protein [Mucilaginibacter sp.]|nr:glycosyltransferase family A protein [Mucilaginibacter sp.]